MKNKSFWLDKCKLPEFKSLEEDISTQVCIIGGGITGITTAYYLSKKGFDVVLIEKDELASKTTGHTTGKVTVQHGLFYKYLLDTYGVTYTEKYLNANLKAINNIKTIIDNEKISCDFEEKTSYVFSNNPQKYKEIEDEVNICKKLDLKASFVKDIGILDNIQGAIKLENQYQFNPIKYLDGLCKCLINNGVKIYENSQVLNYKKNNGKFILDVNTYSGKYKIIADKIITATRYPIFNFPGMFFIKEYQELEYVLCAEVTPNLNNFRNVFVSR